MAGPPQQRSGGLSEEMRCIIRGETTAEEKNKAYQGSLERC
jgi:hypothetical protein